MVRITFISQDGSEQTINAIPGMRIMEAATGNGVSGILGDCGGTCACATCHVYVDEAWRQATGEASAAEKNMIGFTFDPQENSRLSCQIEVTEELDGLILRLPEGQ